MTIDQKLTKILMANIDFGAKNKTIWVSKIVPQIKSLIKETAEKVIGEDESNWFMTPGGKHFDNEAQPKNNLRYEQRNKLNKLLEELKD